ncbi:hypothetical protein LX32DRAFT_699866 [Colletotrichum zoysiae]|uniref:Uncharacterized protein n=1 Tax=Colletotrichum zoysiae TaxID=1216348 RepID=A0AAD9H2S7_9PEZI|nr:hypothetical protein LX32DRAFT_699866 [Colletotrichum zoysiae]
MASRPFILRRQANEPPSPPGSRTDETPWDVTDARVGQASHNLPTAGARRSSFPAATGRPPGCPGLVAPHPDGHPSRPTGWPLASDPPFHTHFPVCSDDD